MNSNDVVKRIQSLGVVPVAVIENEEDAIPVVKALVKGGIDCIEITFRTDSAKDVIQIITDQYPEMLVGAGTVISCIQAEEAIDAGAKFIVSPGINREIVEYVKYRKVLSIPGVMTPTEIETAIGLELEYLKYFPAEALGGIKMLNALCAPYAQVRFMPTGGVTFDNLDKYLKHKKVFACGGSWLIKKEWLDNKQYEMITKETKRTIDLVNAIRVCENG